MSIVLANAFELEHPEFSRAFGLMTGFRCRLQELGNKSNAKLIARKAAEIIDRAATCHLRDGEVPAQIANPLAEAYQLVEQRRKESSASGRRDPEVDFDASVVLCPYQDKMLGLLFTEQEDWAREFFEAPDVLRTPWWNNTDPSEDVSPEEWEARGHAWQQILSRDPARRPSHCGMIFEMTPFLGVPSVDDIVSAQPTFDARYAKVRRDTLMHRKIKGHRAATVSDILQIIAEIERNAETEDHAELEAQCKAAMTEHLHPDDYLGRPFAR